MSIPSAEEKIRAAFDDGSRSLGVWYGITVDHNGVTQNFLVCQKRLKNSKGLAALHLLHLKMGKFLSSLDREPIATFYRLDGKNNLIENGLPSSARAAQIDAWHAAGFSLDRKPLASLPSN